MVGVVPVTPERCISTVSMAYSIGGGMPNRFLTIISWACSSAGFLFGYSASVISGSLMFMEKELGLDALKKGVVTSSILVGGGIGSLIGGKLADHFGRKRVLIAFDVLFIVGVICAVLSPSFLFLVPFRALLGFAAGGQTAVSPIFVAEISTAESRSKMVTLNSFFIVLGELIAYIVSAVLGNLYYNYNSIWRWMNGIAIFPALILLVFHCFFMPESPRWLAGADQMEQAYTTLRQLRKTTVQTKRELREIGGNLAASKKPDLSILNEQIDDEGRQFGLISILCTKWTRKLLIVALGIAITPLVYGICVAMFYGTQVLIHSGMDERIALYANISIGLISWLSAWFGIQIIERMGRRRMLMIGQIGAIFTHLMVAACAYFIPEGPIRAWSILGSLLVFLFFFQASIGPVAGLLVVEMFPLNVRGIGVGLASLVGSTTNCLEGLVFPMAMEQFGYWPTFLFLAGIGFVFLVFIWMFAPETKLKSLEELERQLEVGDWKALKKPGEKKSKKLTEARLSKITEEEGESRTETGEEEERTDQTDPKKY